MRELRFRIWDTAHECYLPVSIGANDGVLGVTIDGTGILYLEDGEVNVQLAGTSGVIIEQYTGLKDKNGKEIYEGDIVLVANHGRTPYAVIYREWDCGFVCKNDGLVDFVHLFNSMPQCYEVIGNIHEGKEEE